MLADSESGHGNRTLIPASGCLNPDRQFGRIGCDSDMRPRHSSPTYNAGLFANAIGTAWAVDLQSTQDVDVICDRQTAHVVHCGDLRIIQLDLTRCPCELSGRHDEL